MPTLKPARKVIRQILGQVRPVSDAGRCLLIGLRKGAAELPEMLDALEQRVGELAGVSGAWFIPELERLVVRREHGDIDATIGGTTQGTIEESVLSCIAEVEETFGHASTRFPTQSKLPDIQSEVPRLFVEMGLDLAGFSTGLLLRKVGGKPYGLFSELSALNLLVEYTPELRVPLDTWVGHNNADLLLRTVATFTESFSQGWSGSVVDLGQRFMQWQSETARIQCWESLSKVSMEAITQLPRGLRLGPKRTVPVPPGAIEQYQATAEKLSLAAFSAGMAFTHDLRRSAATLFSSTPRPAVQGRAGFRLTLTRQLAEDGVLVLDRTVLDCLDRIDRIVVDDNIVRADRMVATTRYPDAQSPVPLETLNDILSGRDQGSDNWAPPQGQHNEHSVLQPNEPDEIPAPIRAWWEATEHPIDALRLVKRGGKICDAALVECVTDHTVESLLSRARAAGLRVSVLAAKDRKTPQRIRNYQARGETIMALGEPALLRHADIAVGRMDRANKWPAGAHILTREPLDTLWRLLTAVEQARTVAKQSVELAKIDAFSGLILALEPMNNRVLSRIRLAANVASVAALLNGYRLGKASRGLPSELLEDPTPWHAMDQDLVIQQLKLKAQSLPAKPAPIKTRTPFPKLWLEEMQNPLVPVLMTGTGLAALTGAVGDALLITAVVGMNGLIGGLQRRKTENQLQELGMDTDSTVLVHRGNRSLTVHEEEVRPGDLITLHAGNVVPADARILSADAVEVDESSLTGESLPVKKSSKPTRNINLAERYSMLYQGTTLVQGKAEAVVVEAKAHSEANRAHYLEGVGVSTGVEARLDRLTRMTIPVAATSGLMLLLNGLVRQRPVPEVVSSGVSLAVAAVPEGLPILATLSQLAAAGRLSERGALARNPRAVEALGRMTVLCADKTGTLTEGRLALHYVDVDGETYSPDILTDRARDVLLVSKLASPEDAERPDSTVQGTDQALGAAVADHVPGIEQEVGQWERVAELPFRSDRGYHATLFRQERRKRVCVKGAPETILSRCNRWQRADGSIVALDDQKRAELEARSHELARQGLRILGVAERPARSLTLNNDKVARLVFRGYVALTDPIREAARDSVDKLRAAGIRVKMITGDHPETAAAIGRELGLNGENSVLTGAEMDTLSDEKLTEVVQATSIIARVTPSQKARLVKALQEAGEVVGMTGDGANDAAAIRLADVGIALGRTSSQSAQQAADLLVMDSRIETIVNAVEEGRSLWSSVRDAVSLLVGGNLGEIGFNLIAGLLEGGAPLNARQLLLINMLTDTFPALAVALRKPKGMGNGQLMGDGPESSLGAALTREIQWRAGLTTGVATATWALSRFLQSPQRASTVGMLTVIGGQLAQTVIAGEGTRNVVITSAASMATLATIVHTPGVSRVFGCTNPGIMGWTLVGGGLATSFVGSLGLPFLERNSAEIESRVAEGVRRWITRDD